MSINTNMNNPLIKSYAKKAKKSEEYVNYLWNEIVCELHKQGLYEDNDRFIPYLSTILKKRLSIKEVSPILKRFKTFLSEKQTN